MPNSSQHRSTFYFLEGIAAILLVGALFASPTGEGILALALLLVGPVWHRARQASWFALVLVSLIGIVRDPTHEAAYILGLAGVYNLFNSGLFGKKPLFFGLGAIVLAVLCQGLGLIARSDRLFENLIHVAAIDGVLALLALVFRKQLLGVEPPKARDLPVLNLAEKGITEAESELLRLFSEGHSPRHLAATLGKSEGTIRNTFSRLYAKLGVSNAVELQRLLHSHQVNYNDSQSPHTPKTLSHL